MVAHHGLWLRVVFSILCAEAWHLSFLAATESRFGQQQSLHGEDSMCVAVVLSHLTYGGRRKGQGTGGCWVRTGDTLCACSVPCCSRVSLLQQ